MLTFLRDFLTRSRRTEGDLILPDAGIVRSCGMNDRILNRRQAGFEILDRLLQISAGVAVAGVVLATPNEAKADVWSWREVSHWNRWHTFTYAEYRPEWNVWGGWTRPRTFINYRPGRFLSRIWRDHDLVCNITVYDGWSDYPYWTGRGVVVVG